MTSPFSIDSSCATAARLLAAPSPLTARTSRARRPPLVSFAADTPHDYEAIEDTHAVLVMSYP